MARPADPVLIPPRNTSEASLRIQQSMPGTSAKGRIEITIPPKDLVPMMFGGERPEPLLSWEFGSVDVTDYLADLEKNRDGTLKRPGPEAGADSWADPMLYDDYCHEDIEGDEVVFTVPDSGNPHFGKTSRRPTEPVVYKSREERLQEWHDAKAAHAQNDPERITDEQLVAEFVEKTGVKIEKPLTEADLSVPTIDPAELDKLPRRTAYEPMKSGVWINVGENEDDIMALHPGPETGRTEDLTPEDRRVVESFLARDNPQAFVDKSLEKTAFVEDKTAALERKVDRLTDAVAALVDLLKAS